MTAATSAMTATRSQLTEIGTTLFTVIVVNRIFEPAASWNHRRTAVTLPPTRFFR